MWMRPLARPLHQLSQPRPAFWNGAGGNIQPFQNDIVLTPDFLREKRRPVRALPQFAQDDMVADQKLIVRSTFDHSRLEGGQPTKLEQCINPHRIECGQVVRQSAHPRPRPPKVGRMAQVQLGEPPNKFVGSRHRMTEFKHDAGILS